MSLFKRFISKGSTPKKTKKKRLKRSTETININNKNNVNFDLINNAKLALLRIQPRKYEVSWNRIYKKEYTLIKVPTKIKTIHDYIRIMSMFIDDPYNAKYITYEAFHGNEDDVYLQDWLLKDERYPIDPVSDVEKFVIIGLNLCEQLNKAEMFTTDIEALLNNIIEISTVINFSN